MSGSSLPSINVRSHSPESSILYSNAAACAHALSVSLGRKPLFSEVLENLASDWLCDVRIDWLSSLSHELSKDSLIDKYLTDSLWSNVCDNFAAGMRS